jgi:pectate lyase
LEVGFTSAAGTLAVGASVEVKARIWKSDWSDFTQNDDYSFNASATSYVDWTKVTAYIAGTLAWGTEAGGSSPDPPTPTDELMGWASVQGMGLDTTTGGGNVTPITVNASDLSQYVSDTTPRVIYVTGQSTASLEIGSNKTIIGLSGAQIGSCTFDGSSNVIMKNLYVTGGVDTISVTGQSHHLWFDHLDISDSSDENLSVVHGSDYITISWCKYHFTRDGDHRFGGLVGHSNNNSSEDEGHLNVTYHHNWYSTGVQSRMPRVRFGKVHIFNNLFDAPDNSYAIRCGVHANIRVENNVFINTNNCFDYNDTSSDAVLESINNVFVGNCTGTTANGSAFVPPYQYTIDPTSNLEEVIREGAGPS